MTPRPPRRVRRPERVREALVRAFRFGSRQLRRWASGPFESTLAVIVFGILASALPLFVICAAFDRFFGKNIAPSGFGGTDSIELGITGGCVGGVGLLLLRFCRPEPSLSERQKLTALVVGLFSAVTLVAIPHMTTGAVGRTDFVAAFVEAAATVSGTNATVVVPETLGGGMLALRAFGQWMGGAAFIIVLVRVLPYLGVGGLDADDGAATSAARRLAPRSAGTMGRLAVMYMALTAAVTVAYRLAGMPIFESGLHALTTVSTGGFSTRTGSLAAFDSAAIEWVAIAGMTAGGMSLPLMFLALRRGDPMVLLRSWEFRFYLTLIVVCSATVVLWTHDTYAHDHLRQSIFSVVAMISTTGYEAVSFQSFSPGSRAIFLVMMAVGGMSASLAGGFKVVRFMTLVSYVGRELRRSIHPSLVQRLRLGRTTITERAMSRIVGELLLASILLIPAALVLARTGLDITESFTFAISSLFNVGPALVWHMEHLNSHDHLSHLTWPGQIAVGLLMLLGRMSVTAAVVALTVAMYPVAHWARHGILRNGLQVQADSAYGYRPGRRRVGSALGKRPSAD